MKMLDKERRKKKHRDKDHTNTIHGHESMTSDGKSNNGFNNKTNAYDVVRATSYDEANTSDMDDGNDDLANKKRPKSSQISNSSIHTEIRTDDLVVRLLFINLFCNIKKNAKHKKKILK